MSSNSDSISLPSKSTSDSNADPHFSPPSCTMCTRREESKSYCTNCKQYLCDLCEFVHKISTNFSSHNVLSLANVQSVEDLEHLLNFEPPFSRNSRFLEAELPSNPQIDGILTTPGALRHSLAILERHKLDTITTINDFCGKVQQRLKDEKDRILNLLEAQFDDLHNTIVSQLETCNRSINNNLIQVTNLMSILNLKLENHQLEEDHKFDINKNPCDESFLLNGSEEFQFAVSLDFPFLNTPSDEQIKKDAATEENQNNNVVPYDPFNISIVASESPRNFKCHVNPDLSLSTTDPDSPSKTNHVNTMQIYKTFGQKGNDSGQLNSPHGFCLGLNEDIVVADTGNHRIQVFDKNGCFKLQFGVPGRHDGYLWHPRKVALLPTQRRYVVCDRGYERSRMQIFTEFGKFIKKIYIQFIDIVAGIAVTANEDIVIVNSATPTVFIFGQNDFLRSIDCTRFMEEPSDIVVIGKQFYICDFKAHCVVVIDDDGNFLRKFGTKHTTMFPNGIDLSPDGYILTGDSHGNLFHIVVYALDGSFVGEFRCPYVKVSRCCGLKITSEGRVVTVDKNYHHVIILESLFGR